MKHKKGFPTFAVILLIFGIVWALNSLGMIEFDFPWMPVVLIIIALGMIVNRFNFCN